MKVPYIIPRKFGWYGQLTHLGPKSTLFCGRETVLFCLERILTRVDAAGNAHISIWQSVWTLARLVQRSTTRPHRFAQAAQIADYQHVELLGLRLEEASSYDTKCPVRFHYCTQIFFRLLPLPVVVRNPASIMESRIVWPEILG